MKRGDSFITRKRRLEHRMTELQNAVEKDIRYLFDTYFESRPEVYFELEEKLLQMQTLFETIQIHVRDATTLSDISLAAGRMQYVEGCFDEIACQIYPRRRRKKRSLFDFFTRYHEQRETGYNNITLKEAYAALGLEEGATLLEATATFRRLAKTYHPDARKGDRSQEAALRRIVNAYQYIKEHFAHAVSS